MKSTKATLRQVLLQHDGPAAFLCEDRLGVTYLAVLTERDEADHFLAVQVRPETAKRIIMGDADLRVPFEKPCIEAYFTIRIADWSQELEVSSLESEVDPELFPEADCFAPCLMRHTEHDEHRAMAMEQRTVLVELSFNPDQRAGETTIFTELLVSGLGSFDRLFRHSAIVAARKGITRALKPEELRTQVIAQKEGSFQLLLRHPEVADAFGKSVAEAALQQISDVFDQTCDLNALESTLSDMKGHFVKSFLRLMDFVDSAASPISISWIRPNGTRTTSKVVNRRSAKTVAEHFRKSKELMEEHLVVVGEIEALDTAKKTWGIRTADHRRFHGKIEADRSVDLHGLVVGGVRYTFKMLEKIEATEAFGEEKVLYILEERPAEMPESPT